MLKMKKTKGDVGRVKKKMRVVPKARKAFQVKYDGQALPLEFLAATREKYEKFIVSHNLLGSSEEEYLETLEKKFKSSKVVDAKSKDGHMVLKWAAFNSVDKMFFFGDNLLCLVNGQYIQVVEYLESTPKRKTWNLFNAHSAAELIDGPKGPRSFTIEVITGCPYMPTLAYVISNSPVIRVMTYPQMSLMAELRSYEEHGDYINLAIGLGECLYGLRAHPGNVIEIWSLRSRSILVTIPASFCSNETIMRLSPVSYSMILIDRGCQDVVRWTLHRNSPLDLHAYPQAVELKSKTNLRIVDASFTFDDELYLLTEGGDIFYVDGSNEIKSCRITTDSNKNQHPSISECLGDFNYQGWSNLVFHHGQLLAINTSVGILKFCKLTRKNHYELESAISIGENAKVATNSCASIFKIGSLIRDTTLVAVMNVEGLSTLKWNVPELSPSDGFQGPINDIAVLRNYAVAIERRQIRVIGLEEGATACTIPMPIQMSKLAAHPFSEVFVVSAEAEGSLYMFRMSSGAIGYLNMYQLFTSPIDLMVFSIRGDFFIVHSQTNDLGFFKINGRQRFELLKVVTVDHNVSSMTIVGLSENQYVMATLENPEDCDHSIIYIYEIPALVCLACIEYPRTLFQLAESVQEGKCFGTTDTGLSVSVYRILLDNEGGGVLQEVKQLKTYDDVCRRRLLANWTHLIVFGTDGCLDIFAQRDENQRLFSVTHNLFMLSGYIIATICPDLKYAVGIHASGVVTCRSLRFRIKPILEDDDAILTQKLLTEGLSSTEEETVICNTKEQKEQERLNEIKISSIEELKNSLDMSFQDELSSAFSDVVSNLNLTVLKYRNLKENERKSRDKIVNTTNDVLEALKLNVYRYKYLFDESGKGGVNGKHFSPTILKGMIEHCYNFYNSSARAIEDESADGILLYCTDLVTISNGFEKYVNPRWLRNSGSGTELSSLTSHSRKRGVDEDAERPKIDLNKKISEAVENFSAFFIKKRVAFAKQNHGSKEEDGANSDLLPIIKIVDGMSDSTEFVSKKEIGDLDFTAELHSAPLRHDDDDGSDEESSDCEPIPDASNDGTEEERLSSDSISSGSTFELPNDDNEQPGLRSSYLIRLLERKEAKKTRKFEMKDGMLKCYNNLNGNIRSFIKKFQGSASHDFLHVFPLAFCPDETDSVLINQVQFLYSKYFVNGLREHYNNKFEEINQMRNNFDCNCVERTNTVNLHEEDRICYPQIGENSESFMIEPLKPSPLMIPLEPAGPNNFGDGTPLPLIKIKICPAKWKDSDKLNNLMEWMQLAMIPACRSCQKEVKI